MDTNLRRGYWREQEPESTRVNPKEEVLPMGRVLFGT
jgi:hypothetical protein